MGRGINHDIKQRATRGYRAAFQGARQRPLPMLEHLAYRLDGSELDGIEEHFTSHQDSEVPQWRGLRIYKDIAWHTFTTEAAVYGEGFRVPRRDLRADRWMHYMDAARGLGRKMRRTIRREGLRFLVHGFGGTKGLAYDGQFFYDSDHADNSGATWTNVHNLALTDANFDTVYQALQAARWPDGQYTLDDYGEGEYTVRLICGPKLEVTAKKIVNATTDAGGDNVRRNRAVVEVIRDLSASDPELSFAADDWYLCAEVPDQEMRPLTFLEVEDMELTEVTDPTQAEVHDTDDYLFGVRGEWGMGYRAPWMIQASRP